MNRDVIQNESPRHARLAVHAAAVGALAVLLTLVWAATTRAFFWPSQAVVPLVLSVMIHAWIVFVAERPRLRERFLGRETLALHAGISGSLWLYLFALWAVGNGGYFWPAWPLLGLATLLAIHAMEIAGRHARARS